MWMSKDALLLEGGTYLSPDAYQRKYGSFAVDP